jgi:AraC-like DNA-binding protein
MADATTFRFSTDTLPPPARARAIGELCERAGGMVEPMEPLGDGPVHARISKRVLPGLTVLSGSLGGLRQRARRGVSVYDSGDLFVGVNLAGECGISHLRGEETVRAGDAILARRDSGGFTVHRPTTSRFLGLRVPSAGVAPLVPAVDGSPRVIPTGTRALRLLASYAGAIEPLDPAALRLVVGHVYDLVALVMGATRDAEHIAQGRGVRAVRLRAVFADVSTNLADPELSAQTVAQRLRVTARYVHKILEGEGTTFSALVLGRRLARAHRMLTDPRFADRTITEIAYDVGFGDLSYFNRAFRRRYGATPSDERQAALSAR